MVAFMATDRILRPYDVARMLGVDPKTVTRYAKAGKLPEGFRTLGGQRRWYESDVLRLVPGARAEQ
jgi:predicted DNA-binding transcriptional regulator AlpA